MEEFYAGKVILLTGGTGFIGKVIIQKLFSSLMMIERCYCLVRPKKGRSGASRLRDEVAMSPIFAKEREVYGQEEFLRHFTYKFKALEGDVSTDNLGLSPSALSLLSAELNIIIHCAATVDFNERLDIAVDMNCLGTLRMLELAHSVKHLHAFVHVSTAYSNSNKRNSRIEEKIYPLDFDVEEAVSSIMEATPAELEKLTINLISTYPNTYTLSKAMAENLVMRRRGTLPVIIVRPSIVGASWREPFPGWVDNVSAAGVIFLAAGLGMMTVIPGNPRGIADLVPVDIVTALVLVSIMQYGGCNDLTVIHACTSDERVNPMKWRIAGKVMDRDYFRKNPCEQRIGPNHISMIQNEQYYELQWFLRYSLPSSLYSFMASILGDARTTEQAARLRKLTWRVRNITEAYRPFTQNEWIFDCEKLLILKGSLPGRDADTFNLDAREIVWERYLQNFCYGLKKWVLHEDMVDVSEEAVKHTELALTTGRILEWDPDHHRISFPGLFADLSWAYTSSRKPGYTKSGLLGRFMGLTGWKEGMNHEASHVPRKRQRKWAEMKNLVLDSDRVQAAIGEEAKRLGGDGGLAAARALKIYKAMAADIQYPTARALAWSLRKIWRKIYDGIIVDEPGINRVRHLAKDKNPIVLIPTHRSYIDFLLLSYIFFAYNLPIPYIAAAEDFQNLGKMSQLLQRAGAFFLKRRKEGEAEKRRDEDLLYYAIFTEYTQRLLMDGQAVEFFIEGTRSRSGKQLKPRFGLLKIVMDALERVTLERGDRSAEAIDDVHLVPITIDYERPLEVSLHQKELLGESKVPESISSLLRASQVLGSQFGSIAVSFSKPISLRSFLSEQSNKGSSPSTPSHSSLVKANAPVEQLGYLLTERLICSSSCMGTHLVAVLLLLHRSGISKGELVERTDWLRREVERRGGTVHCAQGMNKKAVVDRAVRLLGTLVVQRRKDYFEPNVAERENYENLMGLGYYRNKILHLFDIEGIVACAFYSLTSRQRSISVATTRGHNVEIKLAGGIKEDRVEDAVSAEVLKSEASFLLPEFASRFHRLPSVIDGALERIIKHGILEMREPGCLRVERKGERMFSLLCGLMWPFVDSYWVSIVSLLALQRQRGMAESALLHRMQWLAETMYHERVIVHYESCSAETLRNALSFLEQWGVVMRRWDVDEAGNDIPGTKPGNTVMLFLSQEFEDAEKISALADKVGQFRKLPPTFSSPPATLATKLVTQFPILAKL